MFDDFKEESLRLLDIINDHRQRQRPELSVLFHQKDSFGDGSIVCGKCEDYVPELEKFIISFNDIRFATGRL